MRTCCALDLSSMKWYSNLYETVLSRKGKILPPLPCDLSNHAACADKHGTITVVGGYIDFDSMGAEQGVTYDFFTSENVKVKKTQPSAEAWQWSVRTNVWTKLPDMLLSRADAVCGMHVCACSIMNLCVNVLHSDQMLAYLISTVAPDFIGVRLSSALTHLSRRLQLRCRMGVF